MDKATVALLLSSASLIVSTFTFVFTRRDRAEARYVDFIRAVHHTADHLTSMQQTLIQSRATLVSLANIAHQHSLRFRSMYQSMGEMLPEIHDALEVLREFRQSKKFRVSATQRLALEHAVLAGERFRQQFETTLKELSDLYGDLQLAHTIVAETESREK